jgi:hypothetical protein
VNPNSYFENDPWSQMIEGVSSGSVGRVVALAVQAICAPGQMDRTFQDWQTRLAALLGPPLNSDLLRNGPALSVLQRYDGPVIVRLFIDEGPAAPMSNIEIVGSEGLLVWKPDVHPLSVVTSSTGTELMAEHAYAVELKEARS